MFPRTTGQPDHIVITGQHANFTTAVNHTMEYGDKDCRYHPFCTKGSPAAIIGVTKEPILNISLSEATLVPLLSI